MKRFSCSEADIGTCDVVIVFVAKTVVSKDTCNERFGEPDLLGRLHHRIL